MSRRGWVLFIAMSLIWGIPYLMIKVAVGGFPPVVVVFGRTLIGAVLLLPFTIARGQLRPALRHWKVLLLFTLAEVAAPWLLLSYAETRLSSSLSGLLVACVPFVAALLGRLVGDEDRLTPVRYVGMALGVLGIVALLGIDVGGAQLLPLLAIAGVVVGYATGALLVQHRLSDVPGVAASGIAFLVTAIAYAPFAIPRLGVVAHAPVNAILSVVALGVVCTALALALFFMLIREVGPQRSLVITFVNPAVAVVLGVLLLGEPFTLGIGLGLPLVLAGCVLATRKSLPREAEPELGVVPAPAP